MRELVSAATERISCSGLVVNIATDATGPSETIAMSGTAWYGTPRRYSMLGIIPTSIDPSCRRAAHFEGGSNCSAKP